jgi:hypothetical protein
MAKSVTFSPKRRAACDGLTPLVLARRQRRRRKGEALHLRRLRQQGPSSCLLGHDVYVYYKPIRCASAEPGVVVEQRGYRLSTKSMRLCAVVAGQPMEAMRDDGPESPVC